MSFCATFSEKWIQQGSVLLPGGGFSHYPANGACRGCIGSMAWGFPTEYEFLGQLGPAFSIPNIIWVPQCTQKSLCNFWIQMVDSAGPKWPLWTLAAPCLHAAWLAGRVIVAALCCFSSFNIVRDDDDR